MAEFTRSSAERIARVVRRVEGSTIPHAQAARLPFGSIAIYCGKTSGAINKGASGTVVIYNGTSSSGIASTSLTLSSNVYNRFANVADGKWVFVMEFPWGYELFAAEC
jgi:hypothetical protein